MVESEGRGRLFSRLRTAKNIALSRNYSQDVSPEEYERFVMDEKRRGVLARQVADIVVSQIPPIKEDESSASILDIAAGIGIISRELAKRQYQVTATDLSAKALAYLHRQAPDIQAHTADMNVGLPFSDNSFDGATTVWGNRFITDTSMFLQEVSRILKPGSTFVWPIFPREGISWKLNNGLTQPTQVNDLAKDTLQNGFNEAVILRKPFYDNLKTRDLVFHAAPMYILAKK